MAHIFLYGPPGSGKTTLGSRLAASLHMPFVDLDQAIEAKEGMSIPQIMEECGELGFRDAEAETLKEKVSGPEAVIALGGGTLLRAENRRLAEGSGTVVCLRAEPDVLLHRLAGDPRARPLLAGNLEEKLHALLSARADHYNSFGESLDSDEPTEILVERLQVSAGRFHLGAMAAYDVIVKDGVLRELGELLKIRQSKRVIIVTDENVCTRYAQAALRALENSAYEASMLVIPAGESSKTVGTVERLWQGFLEAGLDRTSTVIALGGGVVGDLAGFAASTFMRGINWIGVPTTLLAMVDASIGGKTGFDLPDGKNLIGSFHAPLQVLIDPELLSTLPAAEFRSGLAEVVKHGVIGDIQLFERCARNVSQRDDNRLSEIIRRAVAVKVHIVEQDPFEKGARAALNFGHTVGHAVEAVSQFGIRHGEAVAMGIIAEARLAERLGIAHAGLSDLLAEVLARLGLPTQIPQELPREDLIRVMQNDKKKAAGIVRFALPADVGRMRINVEVADLRLVLEEG